MNTYLPKELINSNYTYYKGANYILVRTNQNCYTNYNTQYCNCYQVYYDLNYTVSNVYSCSTSTGNQLDYKIFKSDYFYRLDIWQILLCLFILLYFGIYVFKSLAKSLMRGVFK